MPGRRRGAGRTSTRAAAAAQKSPTPNPEPSDDEMQDAPSGEATPAELDEDEEDEEDAEGEQDEEDAASVESDVPPARTRTRRSDAGSLAVATPTSTPAVPVKRRPGRPPKNRPPVTFDNSDQAVSDATPKRRGGFRGRSFGGGRWKNRGGPSRVSQVPVDKDGNMATVQDDEVQLEEDPEGEAKVDKLGHLQEGREYRVRTFTIVGRGKRLYMLSTEPARCIGFRDSYLFFQKHKQLFKIILSDDEKMDLIEREIMPHSYKGRSIGVVTARSVFREFGAKIIIGGRKVVDDYQAAACRANGDVEGELAVPDDVLPAPGGDYDRNRYVAWHGASSVYHTGAPTVPLQAGKEAIKKRKVTVTGINWQFEHAREASRFNSTLTYVRRQNNDGVYDMHTNSMHYPAIMQPTHAHWEHIPPSHPDVHSEPTPSTRLLTNGTVPEPSTDAPTHNDNHNTLFKPPTDFMYRNLLTVDVAYRTPTVANAALPSLKNAFGGAIAAPSLSEVHDDVLAELPRECREAFEKERQKELDWRAQWGNETQHGARADIKITF